MASQEAPVNPVPSKRWTQYYAALQLAIQRAAHKWTFVFPSPSPRNDPLFLVASSHKNRLFKT
jgi:hypothetical protein